MKAIPTVALKYAFFSSPLGNMIAVGTDKALSALQFCNEQGRQQVLQRMRATLGRPSLEEDPAALARLIDQIQDVLAGSIPATTVPLHLQGTPFQQKVWRTLTRVPWGKTLSYSQLAAKVGSPAAVRAVASCCARNPVVFLVPCHRVISKNGKLGGYYHGLGFKQQLLERERS